MMNLQKQKEDDLCKSTPNKQDSIKATVSLMISVVERNSKPASVNDVQFG